MAGKARKASQIGNLIESGAWTDTAIAMMDHAVRRWKLRRLAYEEGEWHCTLSPQRALPDWPDEAIETSHPNLSLAIPKGFIEAMRRDVTISEGTRTLT